MIDVSVIIPAYNAAKYIEAAIASATAQSLENIEIIVVDDRSTDDTRERAALMAASDPRISLLALPRNGGPSAARNAGISAARGTWIALLDADDSYEPQRLATLLNLAQGEHADLVADNLMLIEEVDGATAPMMAPGFLPEPRRIDLAEFIERNISKPDAPRANYGFLKPLMRRKFLIDHAIRYDEHVRFAEDFALYVDCLRAGAIWWLHPEPMYRYLVRGNSLTQIQTVGDLDRLRQRQRALLAEARRKGDGRFASLIARHLRGVDRCYYYRGFTDELKARRFGKAMGYFFSGPDSMGLIGLESARQLPLILRKAWRGGYRRRSGS
jgi:glycosyltransferase involved in cell wall biosynthesis